MHWWRVLAIPGIVGISLVALREAWLGKRGGFYRMSHPPPFGWLLTRAGLWMLGQMWPVLVLWALGLQSFD